MLKPRKPTAAPAVILLFWSMALVLLATVGSGLRVDASFGLLELLHGPRGRGVLSIHGASCLLLVAACILYLQRLRQEPLRLRETGFGPTGAPQRRPSAQGALRRASALVSQSFFALVALEALCALLLGAGAGLGMARLHLATTVLLILSVPAYVGLQFAIGGVDLGLRVLRPAPDTPLAAPLGRSETSPRRARRAVPSARVFGFLLGIVFGAAAAMAFVGAVQQPGRVAGLGPSLFQVAWGLPLRPAR